MNNHYIRKCIFYNFKIIEIIEIWFKSMLIKPQFSNLSIQTITHIDIFLRFISFIYFLGKNKLTISNVYILRLFFCQDVQNSFFIFIVFIAHTNTHYKTNKKIT